MVPWPRAQARVHSAVEQTAGVNVDSHVGMCGSTSRPRPGPRPRPRPRGSWKRFLGEEKPRPGPQTPALPWAPPPWWLSALLTQPPPSASGFLAAPVAIWLPQFPPPGPCIFSFLPALALVLEADPFLFPSQLLPRSFLAKWFFSVCV